MSSSTVGFGRGGYGVLPGVGPGPDYYISLLTWQYSAAAPMIAWLRAMLQYFDDAAQCLATFDEAFNLTTAVGVQLDTLGVIIGANRVVPFQPSGGVSPVLDDATYRILLYARRAQNSWDGRIDSLQGIWKGLFPGGGITIQDHQDMTATIILTGAFKSIDQDLITNGFIVPRPQAVLYTFVFGETPLFGFDAETSLIAGFDAGHFA